MRRAREEEENFNIVEGTMAPLASGETYLYNSEPKKANCPNLTNLTIYMHM
jgi:hypothetical protein